MSPEIEAYDRVRGQFPSAMLQEYEVPVEHYVSAPLPTLRWGLPGFAAFAAPALRDPFGPMEVDPPDRWWAVDAFQLNLLVYALTEVVPFTDQVFEDCVSVPSCARPPGAARQDALALTQLMDRAVPDFFAGAAGDPGLRTDLAAALGLVVPAVCADWHRALTPDFFSWLESR